MRQEQAGFAEFYAGSRDDCPHTGQQSQHAFWVDRSAIPCGLGVRIDIYYHGTYGLYAVQASPHCTGS